MRPTFLATCFRVTIPVSALIACGGGAPGPTSPADEAAQSDQSVSGSTDDGESADDLASNFEDSQGSASNTSESSASDAPASRDTEFVLRESDTAKDARGVNPSQIKPSATHAAMKFFVVDKDKGPIQGIVIALTAPDGQKYYTQETDAKGYAEVLVPVGQKYDLVYLSLGRKDIAASVPVTDEPNQNIRLTLRYKRHDIDTGSGSGSAPAGIVLHGINFDTGKASIRKDSFPQLDNVVEYLKHKKSARIRITGHTDNVGDPKANKVLSEKRAQACRDYLISKGIEGDRIEAVGLGDEQPLAANDSVDGRQKNRRIEATEL